MFLYTDAAPLNDRKCVNDVTAEELKNNMLIEIECDLDIEEKVSILFLMLNDYTCGFQKVYDILQRHKKYKTYMITEFKNNHPQKWKNKLLEAICIVQNRQVVRKLGMTYDKLELLYSPKNRLCSRNLNVIAKCLYSLCETLTEEHIKLLLQYVKGDLNEYNENLKDTDCLELHMLYWMERKYIQIHSDGKADLKNLLKHIKRFEGLELIYEDLKNCESYQNARCSKDASNIESTSNAAASQLKTSSKKEETHIPQNIAGEDVKRLKTGLCIIINQMFFLGKNFETRIGTTADCTKLLSTFNSFGFATEVFNNLKKDELLEKLKNIPKEFGTDYDCIFICILSHGCRGGIISADEKEVKIETIEDKICCTELKDVIKIVIIQACQGEVIGQVDNSLTTDGPRNSSASNILGYRNFCIFMSTIQGFVSLRHKEQGSWFIQEFCNILQNGGCKISFLEAVRRVINSVTEKRGELNGTSCVAQLPELRSCRLLTDFYMPECRVHEN